MPHIDLEEFISDYLRIEGAEGDSNRSIAIQYIDATADAELTEAEFEAAVRTLLPQLPYYTGRDS